jgi:hypothetical protein
LHALGGTPRNEENPVLRSPSGFHLLDRYRFLNYDVEHVLKQNAAKPTTWRAACDAFVSSRIKMLSFDKRRVDLADLLADLSVQWILSHEDAHVYAGHAGFFNQRLGISASELAIVDADALQKAAAMLRQDPLAETDEARTIAELYADKVACTRMVDYMLDDELFYFAPMLRKGAEYYEAYCAEGSEGGYNISRQEANLMVVARVAMDIAIGSVLLFHRKVEKEDVTTTDYPNIEVRIANIIFSCWARIVGMIGNKNRKYLSEFALVNPRLLEVVAFGVETDIRVMHWNLLSHPALLQDPDVPEGKTLRFSEM